MQKISVGCPVVGSFLRIQAARARLGCPLAVLAIAGMSTLVAPGVRAADFTAGNETELRDAIAAAAADPDAASTITLTGPITLSTDTPFADLNGKSVTIDTDGNALSGRNIVAGAGAPGSITFPTSTGSLTVIGDFRGGNAAPDAGNVIGGTGLTANGITVTNEGSVTGGDGGDTAAVTQAGKGGIGLRLENGTLINNDTIQGGLGGSSAGALNVQGAGGTGALLIGGTDHVNNGTIRGGAGAGTGIGSAFNPENHPIGLGLVDAALVNNGRIEGGTALAGSAATNADGAYLNNSTLINNSTGVIIGGTSTAAGRAGDGITVVGGDTTIINQGLITQGDHLPGSGAFGIIINGGTSTTIINSGTISGNGTNTGDQAIRANNGLLTLELHGGSVINGKVLARASAGDILRLGGEEDDTFDVSEIGGEGPFPGPQQYLNFNIFEKTGSSTWTITGVALAGLTSPWDIYEGTMLMSAGSDLGDGPVDVFGGILAGVGIVGPTVNHGPSASGPGGAIAPGINGIGTLTVDGAYTGAGGLLAIETVLGDDNSSTDLLAINGGTTGSTFVRVTNLGGAGAQTTEGIKIVDVNADNTGNDASDGAFELLGDFVANGQQAVVGGAYAYSLYQGSVSDPADGDWYLRSIGFSPSAGSYEAYPAVLLGLIDMPTWQQRVGNIYMPNAGSPTDGYVKPEPTADVTQAEPPPANFWTRIEAATGHYEGNSDTGTQYDLDRYKIQAGMDGRMGESMEGILIAGVNVQYGHADADLESDAGDGDNSTDSYGGGLTLTWVGVSGFYADAQAMAHYLESDLGSDLLGKLVNNNEGWGYGLSLELGRKLALDDAVSLTPQAQLYYTSVDFDDFTDEQGVNVSLDEGESLKGRLGMALGFDSSGADSRGHVYAIANLTYEFLDAQSVDVAGVDVEFDPDDWGGELGLGGTYEWSGGRYAVHGEALGQTSFEGSYGVKGTAGFSIKY
jgi:fibronectin-binding autotransporter adhesin